MVNSIKNIEGFQGRVFQINISPGGVPKKSVDSCIVTDKGIVGDSQKNRDVHGGPQRALCLYALELIQKLEHQGHPVYPGALGENLTFSGIKWDQIVPGVKLSIGNRTLIQVTSYTAPCKTISKYFMDERYERISQSLSPGWSRVYAQVVQSGDIKVGDVVLIE